MKADSLAQNLLEIAQKAEPIITEDITKIASIVKAEVVGLENKLKTKESLIRKITNNSNKFKIPLEQISKRTNDVLRYTILFSDEEYQPAFFHILDLLRERKYFVKKIWDAWKNENTEKDTGYRGINITIISSQKQMFELQFHTTDSFRVKTETHGLYDEQRNPKTTDERKQEINEILRELSKQIKRPKGY
jgi:hypothetical protein